MDGHLVAIDGCGPEEPVLFDAGVEIVNLIGPDLGLEDVESYEGERPVTVTTPGAHELALHETQINFVRHSRAHPRP